LEALREAGDASELGVWAARQRARNANEAQSSFIEAN
jgi:hypothetical protein